MKFERKCPCCHRRATKRLGKVSLCESCAKQVKRTRTHYVTGEKPVCCIGNLTVFQDVYIPIY